MRVASAWLPICTCVRSASDALELMVEQRWIRAFATCVALGCSVFPALGRAEQPAGEPAQVAPAPPPAQPKEPAAAVAGMTACIVGQNEGVAPPDARTATALVCESLHRRRASVSIHPMPEADVSGYAAGYRVELRPLGRILILQVTFESPIGVAQQDRSMQLRGVEEVAVAAPRLAEAILRGAEVAETARVDNLVGQETRSYAKQYGEMMFGVGLIGFALPDTIWGGYGAYGRLHYEAAHYAIGGDLRLGGTDQTQRDAHLAGLSLGGRYFLLEGDVTPFVGGGAGILWLTLEDRRALVTYRGSGLAGFGEAGVEFLRLHETRFDILLRIDVPAFELEESSAGGTRSKYRMPVALMASFSF